MFNEDLLLSNIRGWRSQTETGALQGDQPGRRVAGSCAWDSGGAQHQQRQRERWDAGRCERLPRHLCSLRLSTCAPSAHALSTCAPSTRARPPMPCPPWAPSARARPPAPRPPAPRHTPLPCAPTARTPAV